MVTEYKKEFVNKLFLISTLVFSLVALNAHADEVENIRIEQVDKYKKETKKLSLACFNKAQEKHKEREKIRDFTEKCRAQHLSKGKSWKDKKNNKRNIINE